MHKNTSKGFTLVEIMIVVVIIGLLAAMAIPAFNKVRQTSQEKAILNNLRQIASAADQYFIEEGYASANYADLVGTDKYVKSLEPVAREDYATTFPTIATGFTQLQITTPAGLTVTFSQ